MIDSFGTSEADITVGCVNFTSPEIPPTAAPQITTANLQGKLMKIDWMIPSQCPGIIQSYDIEIFCDDFKANGKPQLGNRGNISYDCRSSIKETQLNASVPLECQNSRHLKAQLRIGTKMGTSSWSKPFEIPDSSWPLIVIIAVALGAFIIAVALGALGFFYYYKRHVQNYQGVYKTLNNLLHSRRANGVGQSFRKLPAPRITPPNIPHVIDADSSGTTKFEPTPELQSPCSPVLTTSNKELVQSSPHSDSYSENYNAGKFFE